MTKSSDKKNSNPLSKLPKVKTALSPATPPIPSEPKTKKASATSNQEKNIVIPSNNRDDLHLRINNLDPNAKPLDTLPLLLNEYEYAILQKLSIQEDRSLRKLMAKHLRPVIQELANQIKSKQ